MWNTEMAGVISTAEYSESWRLMWEYQTRERSSHLIDLVVEKWVERSYLEIKRIKWQE